MTVVWLWVAGTAAFMALIGAGGIALAWAALVIMLGAVAFVALRSPRSSGDAS